jgi:hypothetical protein
MPYKPDVQVSSCLCAASQQQPERIVRASLSLLVCRTCDRFVTVDRSGQPVPARPFSTIGRR